MKITGVTMNWAGRPCLCFDNKWILPRAAELLLYGEYYKNGDYPTDPVTGEKLPICEIHKLHLK